MTCAYDSDGILARGELARYGAAGDPDGGAASERYGCRLRRTDIYDTNVLDSKSWVYFTFNGTAYADDAGADGGAGVMLLRIRP